MLFNQGIGDERAEQMPLMLPVEFTSKGFPGTPFQVREVLTPAFDVDSGSVQV